MVNFAAFGELAVVAYERRATATRIIVRRNANVFAEEREREKFMMVNFW